MANTPDLNKLKSEIQSRKDSRNTVPSQLGESVGVGIAPRDTFLHELNQSLKTGQSTPSINLIKSVENKVAEKNNESPKHIINESPSHRATPSQPVNPAGYSEDREEKLYRDLEKNRQLTLADSINNANGGGASTGKQNTVFNGQQYLNAPPAGYQQQPQQMNEGVLNESVQNIVNGYLTENLGSVFEGAIKDTIIEMYAVERIKSVLDENRDLIKNVVYEAIREIQAKNKKK